MTDRGEIDAKISGQSLVRRMISEYQSLSNLQSQNIFEPSSLVSVVTPMNDNLGNLQWSFANKMTFLGTRSIPNDDFLSVSH